MARRPLVATFVTTVVGALLGAVLGAVVGRVIALFGDETVQTNVPMVFCGFIGYVVGGASAAKGSLDRFGARRIGLATTVATLIIIVMVGYAFVSGAAGLVVGLVGVVAAALAGAVAASIGGPQPEPVVRGQRPRAVAPPKQAEAAPQEVIEAEFLDAPPAPEPGPDPAPAPAPASTARPRRDRPLRKGD